LKEIQGRVTTERRGTLKKSKTILVVTLAIFVAGVVALAGCGSKTENNNNNAVGNVTYESIQVDAGEEFQVALDSNPTTGYDWSITTDPDPKVVEQKGSSFVAPKSDLYGAPGKQVYTFNGVATGKTDITFENRQPWDKKAPPAWTHNAAVTVVAAPPKPPAPPKTYTDPKSPVSETVGREFHIDMSEQSASTGYKWLLSSSYDHKVAVFEGVKFLTPTSSAPGAPQVEVWKFEAVGKGTTKLTFNYVQPWDKTAKPAKTMTFTVNVN